VNWTGWLDEMNWTGWLDGVTGGWKGWLDDELDPLCRGKILLGP